MLSQHFHVVKTSSLFQASDKVIKALKNFETSKDVTNNNEINLWYSFMTRITF